MSMRNIVLAVTTGAALAGLAMVAHAASPDERQPEARAYMNFTFGGTGTTAESFFYGLRLDHDSRHTDQPLQPVMAVEFDGTGFSSAKINGMPFTRDLRLNQSGERQWSWVDWGLLAAGVAGLGYVIAEVADSEEESDDPEGGSTTGGTTTGGTTTGDTTGDTTGGLLGGLLGGLGGGGFRGEYGEDALNAVEHQRALDGGTGYMGDLIAEQ